ncbi:hypothetical protein D910_12661, partial [Dendroctonus ponderosae]
MQATRACETSRRNSTERRSKNPKNPLWPRKSISFDRTISILDYGTYDFIIVGSGSAGGVLVNRLTELENVTVLLVEAGSEDPLISKILGILSYMQQSSYDWGYYTTPQANSLLAYINKTKPYARGKVLGGSSTLNGAVNTRGSAENYEKWVELGNDGWAYEECLPYFKKMEKADFSVDIDDEFHGFDGPVHVNVPEDTPVLGEELINAFIELGKNEGDYNGADQFAVSRVQTLLDYNTRSGTAHSYLRPILNRTNLVISLESLATKILISDHVATGIEFWKNGTKYTASAEKEVILSAGVINSPQLLMLSGIGPKEELDKHGIDTIADLPVGQNFVDQVYFQGIFYRYTNTNYSQAFDVLNTYSDISIDLILLLPKSIGNVRLASADPRDFPLIDPNLFSDPEDLETMYKAIEFLQNLENTTAFDRLGIEPIILDLPDCDADFEKQSKDWWICSLQYLSIASLHGIGTTRMGNESQNSVVSSTLKVHGIKSLRVVDCGIMPHQVSGHPSTPAMM